MFSINGKFLVRNINGQIRVAIETIKKLDKLVPLDFIEIVAPESEYSIDGLVNIPIKRIGKGNPYLWEQINFYWYLIKNHRTGVNVLNSHPLLKPDIAYIHDTFFSAYPNVYTSRYGRMQKRFSLMMEKSAAKKAKAIVAVSEFTKNEIIKYHGTEQGKIHVIYNGWQHMNDVKEDTSVFDEFPRITKNEYIMAASGITPQKNFKWILENAANNKNYTYVIVGQREKSTQDETVDLDNVFFTGRVSDGQMKALMHYCKAFIHPAIYEGFGMTPLEAAGCGCKKLVVSKASCLPEIYGESAFYIDPYVANVSIDDIILDNEPDVSLLLSKYNWEKAAEELYKLLCAVER